MIVLKQEGDLVLYEMEIGYEIQFNNETYEYNTYHEALTAFKNFSK